MKLIVEWSPKLEFSLEIGAFGQYFIHKKMVGVVLTFPYESK